MSHHEPQSFRPQVVHEALSLAQMDKVLPLGEASARPVHHLGHHLLERALDNVPVAQNPVKSASQSPLGDQGQRDFQLLRSQVVQNAFRLAAVHVEPPVGQSDPGPLLDDEENVAKGFLGVDLVVEDFVEGGLQGLFQQADEGDLELLRPDVVHD